MQEKSVNQTAYVLEEKAPMGTIQREHLCVSPHVEMAERRNQEETKQSTPENGGQVYVGAIPSKGTLRHEGHQTYHDSHHDHRMETNQASTYESAKRHASPAVIIGVPHDETTQNEEKEETKTIEEKKRRN